ncbi:MAG: sugar kinase [Polyangiaceae bacterium]|nr:sugar kinase [Polyangiaceae bacterium]
MPRVATFGELLLRLRTPGHQRLGQGSTLEASFGGGEANVAVSLAAFGYEARWVSAVPPNPIGDWALGELRRLGVDVSEVRRLGARLGLYFLEVGASQRPSQVVYDRAGSAISEVGPGDVDWPRVLAGAAWFHTTGITPALSPRAAAATEEALTTARRLGIPTSLDLNYRSKLWSEASAREVMTALMAYVDLVIANEEDAERVFGIRAGASAVTQGKLDRERYLDVTRDLFARFPSLRAAAITLRESYSATRNGWSALLAERETHAFARHYEIDVVDRVGAGDSFAAGLIHGRLSGMAPQAAVEFAAAASALKHAIEGDFNRVSMDEVARLVAGDGAGRVSR